MLLLGRFDLPADNATLQTALAQAVSLVGADPAGVVLEGTFPSLAAIRLNLTGAAPDRESGRTATPSGDTREFFSRVVEIAAAPARFETLPVNLAVRAKDCVLALGTAQDGALGITLRECLAGEIELTAVESEIEPALLAMAQKAAKAHGADIQSVRVSFKTTAPRRITATVTAIAKAMFLTATLTIRGELALDDQCNPKLSGLTCTGDGMLANLAAGYLRPKLTELENQTFSLTSLLPGNIELTGVNLEAEPVLRLRATFRCERETK